MQMSSQRRLAEAVASWLHFEFCCHRAKLLDESALKACVGQVLSSLPADRGAMTYSNHAHSCLNQFGGAGRKKEFDYAVFAKTTNLANRKYEYVVECKWANSSSCSDASILEDILRLSLAKQANVQTQCIFVLAGSSASLDKKLNGKIFNSATKRGLIPKKNQSALTLAKVPSSLATSLQKYTGGPAKIHLTPALRFPDRQVNADFGAIAWAIG